jgi:hypothetical protein
MPIPAILGRLAAAAGSVAGRAGIAAGQWGLSQGLSPISRGAQLNLNQRFPNVAPAPEDLFRAHYSGLMNLADLTNGMIFNGIALSPVARDADLSPWWEKVWDAGKPVPGADLVIEMLRRDKLTPEFAEDLLRRGGAYFQDVRNYLKERSDPLSVADILRLHAQGQFGEGTARRLMVWAGVVDKEAQDYLLLDSLAPAPQETLTLLNRRVIGEQTARAYLRASGFKDPAAQDSMLALRYVYPGPADLVSFALREAWDQQTVARFDYDAEFPPEFQFWMERQGAGSDMRTDWQIQQGLAPVTLAQLYWRVHWQALSPTLAYEMFQRLRPGRVRRFQRGDFQPRAFTLADLQQVLKINDYPRPFRDQLAAIAYNVPRLVDIDRFYDLGTIDRAEVYELHLDRGYSPADAETRTSWLTRSIDTKRFKALTGDLGKLAKDGYKAGVLDRRAAARQLAAWYLIGRPAGDAFQQLPAEAQADKALSLPAVVAALGAIDLQEAMAKAKEGIASVRKRFLAGILGSRQARQLLEQVGIGRDKAVDLVTRWRLAMEGPRQLFATRKIAQLARDGILPLQLADNYLANLGWEQPERSYLLAEMRRNYGMQLARAQEKAAKTQAQRVQAIKKQLQEQKRERKELVRGLAYQASRTQLKTYFVRQLLDERDYTRALARLDLTPETIRHELALALLEKQEYWAKKARERRAALKELEPKGATNGQAPQEPVDETENGESADGTDGTRRPAGSVL